MDLDSFAVRVKDVSKVYRLWGSPRDRLIFPLRRLLATLLPARWWKIDSQPLQSYREFHALNNITFDIRKGESWGFIGVNGSGKSTLLKIISGNLRPSTGCVEVDGKVVILDYGNGFNGEFTGKENIYIKAALLGLTRKKINERYDSIVAFAELGDFINQPVKTYSSGMVSRLGFAIVAHVDADIIITDEALAVGDVFFVQKCMRYIKEFLKKGTFLFVSHSTSDVISLCQNAVWLEHGVIRAIGPASKVTQAYLDNTDLASVEDVTSEDSEDLQATIADINKKYITVLGKPVSSENTQSIIFKDSRLEYIKNTVTDNPKHVPVFETDGSNDAGGASILNVSIRDEEGKPFSQMIGGELVTLSVEVMAEHKLVSPIVGFQVLDRLGQILFADNSHLAACKKPFSVDSGAIFTVKFVYQMPLLPSGSYVIRVAVATVTESGITIALRTLNNALAIHSVSAGARHGLVGIPMLSVKLKCQRVANYE